MTYKKELYIVNENELVKNLLLEGVNLQLIVKSYKYKVYVDLLLGGPPYNTGKQFRYNDNLDKNPIGVTLLDSDGE